MKNECDAVGNISPHAARRSHRIPARQVGNEHVRHRLWERAGHAVSGRYDVRRQYEAGLLETLLSWEQDMQLVFP